MSLDETYLGIGVVWKDSECRNSGNGQRDNGEACDDGNLIAADGCSPGCEAPWETWETWGTDVAMGLEDHGCHGFRFPFHSPISPRLIYSL